MHPILFELWGYPVRAFGMAIALGFLLAAHGLWPALLARYGAEPAGDPARARRVALWLLIGALAGGRLAYVGVELLRFWNLGESASPAGAEYWRRPLAALALWRGGLVMYGGLLGALLAGWLGARVQGLAFKPAAATGLTAGFLALAIGRLGCFAVGDDFGRVVPESLAQLPFPITLTVPSGAWLAAHPESLFEPRLAGQTLWATQLWMSANALLLCLLGLWLLPRRRPAEVAWSLLLAYAVTRSGIEFFRGDPVRGLWFQGTLSTSQLVSIPLALLACVQLRKERKALHPSQAGP